jgi:hypothetical protein
MDDGATSSTSRQGVTRQRVAWSRMSVDSSRQRSSPQRRSAAAPQARAIVHHEKERRHRDSTFASSPLLRQAVGRGH